MGSSESVALGSSEASDRGILAVSGREPKVKAKTLEDAREDMETLQEYIHESVAETR